VPLLAGRFLLEASLLTEIAGARFGGGGTVGGPVFAEKETVATELVGSGGGGMFGGECRSEWRQCWLQQMSLCDVWLEWGRWSRGFWGGGGRGDREEWGRQSTWLKERNGPREVSVLMCQARAVSQRQVVVGVKGQKGKHSCRGYSRDGEGVFMVW